MANIISIRPSKDLRNNYSQISDLSRKNPVAITVNGHEDIVIMCHEAYTEQQEYIEALEKRLAMYAHLLKAEDDIKLGRTENAEQAFDSILKQLDKIKL